MYYNKGIPEGIPEVSRARMYVCDMRAYLCVNARARARARERLKHNGGDRGNVQAEVSGSRVSGKPRVSPMQTRNTKGARRNLAKGKQREKGRERKEIRGECTRC